MHSSRWVRLAPLHTNPREESVGLTIIWLMATAGLVAHLAGLW